MDGDEYKRRLKALGITQERFGELSGHGARTGQYWAQHGPNGAAETLLIVLERRPELVSLLDDILAERQAA